MTSAPTYTEPLPTGPVAAPDSQPTENPPAEKKKTEPRPYHIFQEVQEGVFQFIKTVDATSHEGAVKTLGVEAVGKKFGTAPARNWKVVEPKLRPEAVTF